MPIGTTGALDNKAIAATPVLGSRRVLEGFLLPSGYIPIIPPFFSKETDASTEPPFFNTGMQPNQLTRIGLTKNKVTFEKRPVFPSLEPKRVKKYNFLLRLRTTITPKRKGSIWLS